MHIRDIWGSCLAWARGFFKHEPEPVLFTVGEVEALFDRVIKRIVDRGELDVYDPPFDAEYIVDNVCLDSEGADWEFDWRALKQQFGYIHEAVGEAITEGNCIKTFGGLDADDVKDEIADAVKGYAEEAWNEFCACVGERAKEGFSNALGVEMEKEIRRREAAHAAQGT